MSKMLDIIYLTHVFGQDYLSIQDFTAPNGLADDEAWSIKKRFPGETSRASSSAKDWWNPQDIAIPKRPVFRIGLSALACLSLAGWLFSNFLQMRGYVNITGSRIDLSLTCVVMVCWAWIIAFNLPRWKYTVGIASTAVLVILFIVVDSVTLKKESPARTETMLNPAMAKDLESIKQLIGGKDDHAIQELFAFSSMEEMNVVYVRFVIANSSGDAHTKGLYKDPFDGLEMQHLFSTEIGQLYKKGGAYVYDPLSDRNVSMIVLHPRYVATKKTLDIIQNSKNLPPDVAQALTDFNDQVQANANGLIEFLNNMRHKDPNYFLK